MDDMRNSFTKNIAFYRKQKAILQKELALQLGTSVSAVCNWEKGLSTPPLDTIGRVCDVLEISPAELLGITPELLPDDMVLLDAYHQHPEMQDAIKRLLNII